MLLFFLNKTGYCCYCWGIDCYDHWAPFRIDHLHVKKKKVFDCLKYIIFNLDFEQTLNNNLKCSKVYSLFNKNVKCYCNLMYTIYRCCIITAFSSWKYFNCSYNNYLMSETMRSAIYSRWIIMKDLNFHIELLRNTSQYHKYS